MILPVAVQMPIIYYQAGSQTHSTITCFFDNYNVSWWTFCFKVLCVTIVLQHCWRANQKRMGISWTLFKIAFMCSRCDKLSQKFPIQGEHICSSLWITVHMILFATNTKTPFLRSPHKTYVSHLPPGTVPWPLSISKCQNKIMTATTFVLLCSGEESPRFRKISMLIVKRNINQIPKLRLG